MIHSLFYYISPTSVTTNSMTNMMTNMMTIMTTNIVIMTRIIYACGNIRGRNSERIGETLVIIYGDFKWNKKWRNRNAPVVVFACSINIFTMAHRVSLFISRCITESHSAIHYYFQ